MDEPTRNQPETSDLRVRFAAILDNEARAHDERFRDIAAIASGESVLDIGCGTGESTRQAAAASRTGTVVGVDITPGSIEYAREISGDAANVEYVVADAQTDDLGHERFDVVISRFGVMFFSDPLAAFANIAHAVRPGGRLVLLVWQERDRNEWAGLPAALTRGWQPDPSLPDPFSLGDHDVTTAILDSAGFTDIRFEAVDEPVRYGDDLDTAVAFVSGFRDVRAAIDRATDPDAAQATVRQIVRDHFDEENGVRFEAGAWIVTATRGRSSSS